MTTELLKYLDEDLTALILERWPGNNLELPRLTFDHPPVMPRLPLYRAPREEPAPECFSFTVRFVAPITCTEEELRATPPIDLEWHVRGLLR